MLDTIPDTAVRSAYSQQQLRFLLWQVITRAITQERRWEKKH